MTYNKMRWIVLNSIRNQIYVLNRSNTTKETEYILQRLEDTKELWPSRHEMYLKDVGLI